MRSFLGGVGITFALVAAMMAAHQGDWLELAWCLAAMGWCLIWLLDAYPPQERDRGHDKRKPMRQYVLLICALGALGLLMQAVAFYLLAVHGS